VPPHVGKGNSSSLCLMYWGIRPDHYLLPEGGTAVTAASVGPVLYEYMEANRAHRPAVKAAVSAALNGCPGGCNPGVWRFWAAAIAILSGVICAGTTGEFGCESVPGCLGESGTEFGLMVMLYSDNAIT